jgi:hypothetical protein
MLFKKRINNKIHTLLEPGIGWSGGLAGDGFVD